MELHESTRWAFQAARRRASVATSIQANLLHTAIYDAREAGMSVRETADAFSVPKSTVARHWRKGHRCPSEPPTWGSESEWTDANRAIWAHDPDRREDHVPWRWHDDGSIEAVPSGVATLSEWPVAAPWTLPTEAEARPGRFTVSFTLRVTGQPQAYHIAAEAESQERIAAFDEVLRRLAAAGVEHIGVDEWNADQSGMPARATIPASTKTEARQRVLDIARELPPGLELTLDETS